MPASTRSIPQRGWRRLAAAIAFAACLVPVSLSTAQPGPPRFVEGVVLVGFHPSATAQQRAAARSAVGVAQGTRLSALARDVELLRLPAGQRTEAAIKALARAPGVRYAEPDWILTRAQAQVSNDPDYTGGRLWGLYGDATSPANAFGSQAGEAWAAGHIGSRTVYVGVIDEGIDVTHPDLVDNVWVNPLDPVDGIDNDGNGFIDDTHGWDFVSNDRSVYDGTTDDHGTHVAGTIGATGGNGTGVVGVNWQVRLISAKFLGDSGGTTSNAVRAVDYITDLKVRHRINIVATSNSWGGGGFSQTLLDAIVRGGEQDILFVAAAGNSSSNNDLGGYYPSGYACTTSRGLNCVVSVAATTSTGALASFSSYGANTVHLGAPGNDIRSTLPGGTYGNYSGTSMATPHVSGAVALCASIDPAQNAIDLRNAVLGTTAQTSSLIGRTVTGGRLDVGTMTSVCVPPTQPPQGAPGSLSVTALNASSLQLDWVDSVLYESGFEIQRSPAGCGAFTTIAQVAPGATRYVASGLAASTSYCFRVRATSRWLTNGERTVTAWTNEASGQTASPPAPYACRADSAPWIDTTGGQALTLTDDSQAAVTLPFAFPFYAAPQTAARVSSNGFLRFGTGTATAYANGTIPSTADPNGFVAPFWDDLNPGAGGVVRTIVTGAVGARRFVASWEDVPHYSVAGSTLSFQVQLEEDTGQIVLAYRDVIAGNAAYDRGASATVGIEDPDGAYGTQVAANSAVLNDGTAYRCVPGGPAATVPAAPTSLRASATSPTQVSLAWTDASNNEDGFTVERALSGSSTWTQVGAPAANATSWVDSGVSAGTAYTYRVRSRNGAGSSAWSNTASVTTPAATPAAPTGLVVGTVTSTTVALSWTDASNNEDGFTVERAPAGGTTWASVGAPGPNATSWSDAGLTPGTGYQYRVLARNTAGSSAPSNTVSATTLQVPPTAPTGLTPTSVGVTQVSLSWTDTSSNETGFVVERTPSGLGTWTALGAGPLPANTTAFTDTTAQAATRYDYRVVASNAVGSAASASVTVTTQAAPVSVPAVPTGVTATATRLSVTVTWTDTAANETGFVVGRQTYNSKSRTWSATTEVGTTAADTPRFTHTVSAGTYRYVVRAVNSAGTSAWSAVSPQVVAKR